MLKKEFSFRKDSSSLCSDITKSSETIFTIYMIVIAFQSLSMYRYSITTLQLCVGVFLKIVVEVCSVCSHLCHDERNLFY